MYAEQAPYTRGLYWNGKVGVRDNLVVGAPNRYVGDTPVWETGCNFGVVSASVDARVKVGTRSESEITVMAGLGLHFKHYDVDRRANVWGPLVGMNCA